MILSPLNRSRARRCATALRRYGSDGADPGHLIDLLADARHWCDAHDEDFAALDRVAYEHYVTEMHDSARRLL